MSPVEKIEMVKLFLGETDPSIDEKVSAYLTAAGKEIVAWRYSYSAQKIAEIPDEYEMTQIHAVVAGYSMSGAENQTYHSENGINRTFKYSDMLAYIRANVIPMAGVV